MGQNWAFGPPDFGSSRGPWHFEVIEEKYLASKMLEWGCVRVCYQIPKFVYLLFKQQKKVISFLKEENFVI